jgi:muscarinic acetylcholine receptor
MASLTGNHHSSAIAHALLNNISYVNFIRPSHAVTYRTNWSISYIPGPPPLPSSFLTSTINNSTNDKYYPFWLLILVAVFGSITSVLTVLGNILVILAFFLDRQIRQPTNYFILSLSVSDFLIGLLSMPLLTIYIYAKDWPLNAIVCDIWLSLDYTVCLTSIYTVLFITIDRFCSVKMPAKYRKWRTKRKINLMILITWAGLLIDFIFFV